MSKIMKYSFYLESVSPLFFGSSESGQLLRNSDGIPFVTGNSIGGAIRSFLDRHYNKDIVIETLGGKKSCDDEEDGKNKIKFIESKVIISDGIIDHLETDVNKKEGTRVDRATATAYDGSKYEFEYLSEGIKVRFQIEGECDKNFTEENFKDFISYVVDGFNSGELTLGGHFNEGFGEFNLIKLEKKEFDLATIDGLKRYIFERKNESGKLIDIKEYVKNHLQYDKVVFKLEGCFPYGVYQNFDIKDYVGVSGIQKNKKGYYIPSSSIKGLIKSEIEKLYNSLSYCDRDICEILFGGKDSKGKLRFKNVLLDDSKEIKVYKPKNKNRNKEEGHNYPTYNKVDRLTGSSYNNALFSQREIEGKAVITFSLSKFNSFEKNIYPILIILRNIGLGIIPIGGRTSVGLGEFRASGIKLVTNEYEINIQFDDKGSISIDNDEKLNDLKQSFEENSELKEA